MITKWIVCLPFELPWVSEARTYEEVEQQILGFIGEDSIPSGTVIVEENDDNSSII